MAARILPGKGTLLQIKISTVWTTIGNRVKLDGPDPELVMRDTTTPDSTMKSKAPAIPDPGTLSGTLFFDPNDLVTHTVCRAQIYAPPSASQLFQLVYNDGGVTTQATDSFNGYFTKWKVTGIEVEDSVQAEFEIQITDAFSVAQATPTIL